LRASVHELIPVGPLRIRLVLPPGSAGAAAHLLVTDWAQVTVAAVTDHEVVAVE